MNSEIDRKIAVIFVADVVGYSKHMEKDENATIKSYNACEKILNKLLKKYKGSVFNTAGDSVLAEFPSAVNAAECGVDFQNEIKKRNQSDKTDVKLEFRLGINMGDVVKKEGNLIGDGVNIAARLEALAQPGGITISKSVYDFVVPKTKMTFNDLGVQKVKQNEFHAFDILLDPSQKRTLKTKPKSNMPLIGAIAAALIISFLCFSFYFSDFYKGSEGKSSEKSLTADMPSILVMPFENQTGKKENNFVGEGFTSSLINILSQSKKLQIHSSSTGEYIKENKIPKEEIKSLYNVEYILNGSIQGITNNFRVFIELTDIANNEILWTELFKFKNIDDIFEIMDNLGVSVLRELNLKFSIDSDHLISRNPKVYRKYIMAQAAYQRNNPEDNYKSEKIYKEALELEPSNSRLKYFLGWVHWQRINLGISTDPEADFSKAYQFSLEAMEKNPDWASPQAQVAVLEGIMRKHDIACKRLPNMRPLARTVEDISLVAIVEAICGNTDKSNLLFEKSLRLGPHYSSWVKKYYAINKTRSGDFEGAKNFLEKQLRQKHSWDGAEKTFYIMLAYINVKEGNLKKAKRFFELQKEKDGIGETAKQFLSDNSAAKDQSFFIDVVETLKPLGLPEN